MSQPLCRICGTETTSSVTAREMMLGLRDAFVYDECAACGCVQLRTPPDDASRYYPSEYYSLQPAGRRGLLDVTLRRARNAVLFRNPLGVGHALARVSRRFPQELVYWFAHTRTRPHSRILDVGAGTGLLVRDLGAAGFSSVLGIDPYVNGSIRYARGARVERATIHEVEREFDLIMFHHSLEHMADQRGTLRRAATLLSPSGWCIVRVPLASSHAWRHYREHWVQLDAPRHHVLHSVDSLTRIARDAGLRLRRVEHDSTALQFYASEAYRRDVPLPQAAALFSASEMEAFRRRADELNAVGDGDQACFYFQRA